MVASWGKIKTDDCPPTQFADVPLLWLGNWDSQRNAGFL